MTETAKDHGDPRLRQVSFFLPNRLGSLRRALQILEERNVRIGGISTLEGADHAVVRLVVDVPDGAAQLLSEAGYGTCVTECIGVALPAGPRFGIQKVLSVLLGGEVNVWYAYALILRADGHPVLALQVDDREMAGRVLRRHGFEMVGQDDLVWPDIGAG